MIRVMNEGLGAGAGAHGPDDPAEVLEGVKM
jgi:hypothetical protein